MSTRSKVGLKKLDRGYLSSVLLLMFAFPLLSTWIEWSRFRTNLSLWGLIGKWFVFWAMGVRLTIAGLRQAIDPQFSARDIFRIKAKDALVVVRELGFANLALGSMAAVSLFSPASRSAAALAGTVFFGLAGFSHWVRRRASLNESIAMASDLAIAAILAAYLTRKIRLPF